MKTLLPLIATCIFSFTSLTSLTARAEEKNGLSVNVNKVTLEKKESQAWTEAKGHYETTNRTQALKVTVKNTSFKPMPEGELEWKIVVVGSYSSHLQSGSEKVKGLKPANIQELVIGNAEVTGSRKGTSRKEDRLEWQLTVKQGETEIIKSQSCPEFDDLAKRATKAFDKNAGAAVGKDGGERGGKDGGKN